MVNSPDAAGLIGQSNEKGRGVWLNLSAPASFAELQRLRFWHLDFQQLGDNVGQLTRCSFDASLTWPPSGSFDYFVNWGAQWFYPDYWFGPEIYSGMAIADLLGADPIIVKLAEDGSYLTQLESAGEVVSLANGQWKHNPSHRTWDLTLPRDATPYDVTVTASGTATARGVSSMTDAGAGWAPNEHRGNWVVMDGQEAEIAGNTSDTLTFFAWYWGGITGALPAVGGYQIQRRAFTQASLAKHFVEGFLVAAQAAAGGGTANFNLRWLGTCIGESDALELGRAQLAKHNMLALIWYVRRRAVSLGLTTRAAKDIGVAISLIKELNRLPGEVSGGTRPWPYASIVNQAYREIADADPNIEKVEVEDLDLGGPTGSDRLHYNHDGQKEHGIRRGEAFVKLATPSTVARKSHQHYGEHHVMRPVWGIGRVDGSIRLADRAALQAVPDANKLYPGFYVFRDPGDGRRAIYMNREGTLLSMSSTDGPRLGYASVTREQGMVPAAFFDAIAGRQSGGIGGRRRLQPAVLHTGTVEGFVFPMNTGNFDAFDGEEVTVSLGARSDVVSHRPTVNRIVSDVPTVGASDWLLRAHSGMRAINGELDVREVVGVSPTVTSWLFHRITHGDTTEAQVDGVGFTKMPTVITRSASPTRFDCTMVAMDRNTDPSQAAAGVGGELYDHDADLAECEAVFWPRATIRQQVDPHWNGITGCYRIVYEWVAAFDIGGPDVSMFPRIAAHLTNDFDTAELYDPVADVVHALPWGGISANQYFDVTASSLITYSKTGASISIVSVPLTAERGMVVWRNSVTGMAVGLYADLNPLLEERARVPVLRLGQHREPPVAAAPGFASYDQRNWCTLRQEGEVGAGEDAFLIRANEGLRVAGFLAFGTMADVKLAAVQLSLANVNASWTD